MVKRFTWDEHEGGWCDQVGELFSTNEVLVRESDYRALRAAYAEAIQDLRDWPCYASEYFKDKHDLAGILKLHDERLADFAFDAGDEQITAPGTSP